MARPGGKNPSGSPKSSAASLGSKSKGVQRGNIKSGTPTTQLVNPISPSQSGAEDVVAARNAQAMQGVMLQKQLKKDKSKGITLK